jgi:DNA-binding GntR family transcriptional regulator
MKAAKLPLNVNGATRASVITAKLEVDILAGRLRPGARLDEEGIGKRFGVSRTPVREAFKHLASSGLIELKPHTGAYVARLTITSVVEMFEMMAILEGACAALAARRHDAHDRSAINAAQEACRRAAKRNDPERFYDANAKLHEAIYRASRNGYVETQTLALRNRLEPYRRSITFHSGLMEKSMGEHQQVIDAIFEMDEATALKSMAGHLDTLRTDVVTMVEAISRPAIEVRPRKRAPARHGVAKEMPRGAKLRAK